MTLGSSRPASVVLTLQDRSGPVTGCLQALRSTTASTQKEALSRLTQALGNESPAPDVLWVVGRLAREGVPGAAALMQRWSEVVPAAPSPGPPDPERDRAVSESWNMTGGWMPPVEQIPAMVERCALRASSADLDLLAMLCWRTPHPDHAAWKEALGDQLPAVTRAVSEGLRQGHDHDANPGPALTLLNYLPREFPEACGPDWVKTHLAPALRTLPEDDQIAQALFDDFPTDSGHALLGELMRERPSALTGWRLSFLTSLSQNSEFVPTSGEAVWLSQWLLPRPASDANDQVAEATSVQLLARFGEAHPEEFSRLQLPDNNLTSRALPQAYLERLLQRPPGSGGHLASVSGALARVTGLSPERRGEIRDQLVADFASGRSLEGDVRLPLLDGDPGARRELAARLLPGLAQKQPGEDLNEAYRSQLNKLRQAWLKGEPQAVSPSDLLLRHEAAMLAAPARWMEVMEPALRGWTQELEARGEAPQAIERARAALGRQGVLEGSEMLDVGAAVLLCQGHPSRLLELVQGIEPASLARLSAAPIGSNSPHDYALWSTTDDLRNQIKAPELVSACHTLPRSAALLGHTAALYPSGEEPARQALVARFQEEGPPESAALVVELDRQGVLKEGLSALVATAPNLDQHAELALRLLQRATHSEPGERVAETSRDLRQALELISQGQTEDSAFQDVLARKLGKASAGGPAVDLGGPRPSIGGILMPRRRTT